VDRILCSVSHFMSFCKSENELKRIPVRRNKRKLLHVAGEKYIPKTSSSTLRGNIRTIQKHNQISQYHQYLVLFRPGGILRAQKAMPSDQSSQYWARWTKELKTTWASPLQTMILKAWSASRIVPKDLVHDFIEVRKTKALGSIPSLDGCCGSHFVRINVTPINRLFFKSTKR
jgi:hypothetical protein